MAISEKALKILEFDKILKMLSDCSSTEGAKEAALKVKPSSDPRVVRRLMQQTSDAKYLESYKGQPPFGGVKDIVMAVDRAQKGSTLTTAELLNIGSVLRTARLMIDYIKVEHKSETSLDEIFARLSANKQLEDRIFKKIISEDLIADDASPALSDIRRKIRNTNSKIKDNLQKFVSGAYGKFLQENIVTIRGGRYVVPVKAECKNEIKGLVHDASSSGATLFIEPLAVVEANNELRELEHKEAKEIERILYELSSDTALCSDDLITNYHTITEIACIFARSELSYRMRGTEPIIRDDKRLDLKRARHPLIPSDKVVPINVELGRHFDTLIITGPNTGGKTVTLKTLGLLSLMAQAGLHIPADDSSEVCVFDHIYADIGDEQSIEQSLSTFSSHMKNIVSILKYINSNSMVLFDELGAGTDPVEGAALAVALLETVKEKGALCAATTHYAELKSYAIETPGTMNASCEFDIETLAPTYRLIIGAPGKSNAFEISRKLGLPNKIIERAGSFVNSDSKKFERVIEKLDTERREMERQREEAERIKREHTEYAEESEKKINQRLEMAEKELEKAQAQAKQIIDSARASSEFVFDQLDKLQKKKESERLAQELDEARRGIRSQLRSSEDEVNPVIRKTAEGYVLPRPLKKGDEVKLIDLSKNGILNSDPDRSGNVFVKVGMMNIRTNIKNLMLVEANISVTTADKKKRSVESFIGMTSQRSVNFKPEIDLRGMTGDDAWFAVDKYLDDACLSNIHSVTLIHGKGTGELRKAIWRQLKNDKRIESFRPGNFGEGDYGVTVVELK